MLWNHFDYNGSLLWLCFGKGCHNILPSLNSHGPGEDSCCVLSFPSFSAEMVADSSSEFSSSKDSKIRIVCSLVLCLWCIICFWNLYYSPKVVIGLLWPSIFRSWFLSIHVWELLLQYWRKKLGKAFFFYPLSRCSQTQSKQCQINSHVSNKCVFWVCVAIFLLDSIWVKITHIIFVYKLWRDIIPQHIKCVDILLAHSWA